MQTLARRISERNPLAIDVFGLFTVGAQVDILCGADQGKPRIHLPGDRGHKQA